MRTFAMRRIMRHADPAVSREIGISRLLEFGLELYSTPPAFFYYGSWFSNGHRGHKRLQCGMTACAGGHAVLAFGLLCGYSAQHRLPKLHMAGWRRSTVDIGATLEALFYITPEEEEYIFMMGPRDGDYATRAYLRRLGLPTNSLRAHSSITEVADRIVQFCAAVTKHEKFCLPQPLVERAKERAPKQAVLLPQSALVG